MKKNLSNSLTLEVLEIVGLSNKPLSSREIEKRWHETKFKSKSIPNKSKTNSQIYSKINEISGKNYYKTDSISYNDFIDNLNDSNYKLKLLKIIDKIFPIDNTPTKIRKDDNYDINKSIKLKDEFDSTNKKGYLKIHVNDKSKFGFDNALIYVDLNLEEVSLSISGIDDENNKYSQRGILRKDDYNPDNFDISFDKNNINPPFLDISLKESKQEEINNIQKNRKIVANQKTLKKKGYDELFFGVLTQEEGRKMFNEIEKIRQKQNTPYYFRYSLNLRGFLHYLIHMKSPEKVDKIIQSLLHNKEVKDQFYFLNHTKSIDTKIGGKKNRIEILRQIAKELESMLEHSPISPDLKKESTNRYFSRINRIISQFPAGLYDRLIGEEGYKEWIEYKIRILKSMINYEKELLSTILKELSFTEKQRRQIENTLSCNP